MSVTFVRGDIFLTQAGAIAIGLNAAGRVEVSPFYKALYDRFPVFTSEHRRKGRAGLWTPGDVWLWRDSRPWLIGLIVRETPQGATRLRYVEAAMLNLYQNWERDGLRDLALMRLAADEEWPAVRKIVQDSLSRIALPVCVYENYDPGIAAERPGDQPPKPGA